MRRSWTACAVLAALAAALVVAPRAARAVRTDKPELLARHCLAITGKPLAATYQLMSAFGYDASQPGRLTVDARTPEWVRDELVRMGYTLDVAEHNSGPLNAILFDRAHGTLRGGSSSSGEDYGIGW